MAVNVLTVPARLVVELNISHRVAQVQETSGTKSGNSTLMKINKPLSAHLSGCGTTFRCLSGDSKDHTDGEHALPQPGSGKVNTDT